jgi:hypothetical protein
MKTNPHIERAIFHEVYVDLYGYSTGWIDRIQKEVGDAYEVETSDEEEDYNYVLCVAIASRFRTTDKKRADQLVKKVQRLLNLAQKTYKKLS